MEKINEFVLKEPLPDRERAVVLRESAFEKPNSFTSRGVFLFDKFAKYLKQAENIIKINGKLYIYRDGIYESGDIMVKEKGLQLQPFFMKLIDDSCPIVRL